MTWFTIGSSSIFSYSLYKMGRGSFLIIVRNNHRDCHVVLPWNPSGIGRTRNDRIILIVIYMVNRL